MFVWRFIGLIGFLCTGISYCDDYSSTTTEAEPEDPEVRIELAIADSQSQPSAKTEHNISTYDEVITETNSITTSVPELLSCHECINCSSKSDSAIRMCEAGINMCYEVHKRINKTSRLISRGCSTSKGQCAVPQNDQLNSYDTITCCKSHNCNHAAPVNLSLLLSLLSLLTSLISFIRT